MDTGRSAVRPTCATDRVTNRHYEVCKEKDEYQRGESCPRLVKGPFPKRAHVNPDETGTTINLTLTACDKMSAPSGVFKVCNVQSIQIG